jgi:hypothetical protein
MSIIYGILSPLCAIIALADHEPLYMVAAALFNIAFEIDCKIRFKVEVEKSE